MGAEPVSVNSGIVIVTFIRKILFKVNKCSITDLEIMKNNSVYDAKSF